MERIEGLVTKGLRIDDAHLFHFAVCDGKALTREREAYKSSLLLAPGETLGTISDADEATIAYIVARWPRRPAEVS